MKNQIDRNQICVDSLMKEQLSISFCFYLVSLFCFEIFVWRWLSEITKNKPDRTGIGGSHRSTLSPNPKIQYEPIFFWKEILWMHLFGSRFTALANVSYEPISIVFFLLSATKAWIPKNSHIVLMLKSKMVHQTVENLANNVVPTKMPAAAFGMANYPNW